MGIPFYTELAPQQPFDFISFKPRAEMPNIHDLSGLFSYAIVTVGEKSYLLLNNMQNGQSNHGAFQMWLRRLPNPTGATSTIELGGEIIFAHGEILIWNAQSSAYGQGSSLDDKNLSNLDQFTTDVKKFHLPEASFRAGDVQLEYDKYFDKNGQFIETTKFQ